MVSNRVKVYPGSMYMKRAAAATVKRRSSQRKNRTHKYFLFHPEDPKRSFDVYIDKNPSDTIHIKYTTVDDVKQTIEKLERLYKAKRYPHKRIWQVGMIMKVRLQVLRRKKPVQYQIAKSYFTFLGERTKMLPEERYKSVFLP